MAEHESPLDHLKKEFELLHSHVRVGEKSVDFRLAIVERAMEKISKNSSKLVWVGVSILAALIVNLVTGHVSLH